MRILAFLILVSLVFSCKPDAPKTIPTYSIEQFFANDQIGGGSFSDDESKLLISSNESGIFNAYEIDLKTKAKKQLTHSSKESYFGMGYIPGTNDILYSADKGGNEINHIYLQKEDGTVKDLTPGENEKASFLGWSKDKQYMYYSSNKRDDKYFDLYKMNPKDWTSEMFYKNVDGISASDFTNDENTLALTKSITTSTNQLWILNKTTGIRTEISDPENPGLYSSSGFSDDGKTLFYTTDKGKEFTYLMEYDIATGKEKILYAGDWAVSYSYLSETERYRVIGTNEDGQTKIQLIDNSTQKKIDLPKIDGNVVGLRISDSEQNIRMTVGTSKAPNNIYVYNLGTKQLTQYTETLNKEIDGNNLVTSEVVRYKSFDGLEIPAIYYKPLNASASYKVPAMVWVHGGPGGQSRVGFSSFIQYLVNHGYAVLAVNNRGSSGYGKTFFTLDDQNHGDKDLKDCIWGKKWLAGQDYIDENKIGIIGGSYGGYMTMAAMAFTPDEFKVGVNIFGVTNWLRTLKSIPPYWESFREALYKEMGDPNTADSVRLYNISPVFHGANVKNPVMVLQGANDPRVLQIESDEMVAAIKENDVYCEYVVFPDEGHGFRKKENEIKAYGDVLVFLDKYLKKENSN